PAASGRSAPNRTRGPERPEGRPRATTSTGSAVSSFEHQLLHAPRFNFADDDLVRVAAVHHVDHLEAAEFLAWMAELAEHRAIELHLVDLAGVGPRALRIAVRVRVRREHVLMRPGRDAHAPPGAEVRVLLHRLEIVVEFLITVV